MATGTSGRCWWSCPEPKPSRTSRLCCPGVSSWPNADQQLAVAARARFIDRLHNIIKKLGIDYVDHITATKSYRTAAEALACADLRANEAVRTGRYDLVIFQAGADIHVNDPLGGLLTTEQMIQRDASVFQGCAENGIPLVWNLAGGYKRDADGGIAPVLALHRNTMIECIRSKIQCAHATKETYAVRNTGG